MPKQLANGRSSLGKAVARIWHCLNVRTELLRRPLSVGVHIAKAMIDLQ